MLGEENTVFGTEDMTAGGKTPPLASASGSVLLNEQSSAPVGIDRAAGAAEPALKGSVRTRSDQSVADRQVPVKRGKLLIMIPAYNEGGRVGTVVRDVRRTLPDADVLVIDDGSEDATPSEAAGAGAIALTLPANCGYGSLYPLIVWTGYSSRIFPTFAISADSPAALVHSLSRARRMCFLQTVRTSSSGG